MEKKYKIEYLPSSAKNLTEIVDYIKLIASICIKFSR